MNLELGLIVAFAIIALGGFAMTGFLLWLRSCENDKASHNQNGVKHA